jgi:hypothetical protein
MTVPVHHTTSLVIVGFWMINHNHPVTSMFLTEFSNLDQLHPVTHVR